MPRFVRFEDFIAETADATHGTASRSGFVVNAAPEFAQSDAGKNELDKMRKYILSYYDHGKIKPVKTYLSSTGDHIDCFPVDQQPALRGVPEAEIKRRLTPPPYAGPGAPLKAPALAMAPGARPPSKDQMGNERVCPEGTVPIRRLDLDNLTRFGKLGDFFRKPPHLGVRFPARATASAKDATVPSAVVPGFSTPVAGADRYHAHASQVVMPGQDHFTGGGSSMNVWAPDPGPSVFSLCQLWIVATDSGGSPLQTIEGGWIVWPQRYGHKKPVLFIFFTADGYAQSADGHYLNSGWNGFIDNLGTPGDATSQTSFVLNDQQSHRWVIAEPVDPHSSVGEDNQVGFLMHWQRDPNTMDWWLFVGDGNTGEVEAIGFFKHEIFNGGPLVTDMAANVVDFGGEVQNPLPTAGPMGSGNLADGGFGQSAFHKQVIYLNSGGQAAPAQLNPETEQDAPPEFYNIKVGTDADWGTFLFFGGPGGS